MKIRTAHTKIRWCICICAVWSESVQLYVFMSTQTNAKVTAYPQTTRIMFCSPLQKPRHDVPVLIIDDIPYDKLLLLLLLFFSTRLFKPAYVKTYSKTWATTEDSDQPAHRRCLIRVFADIMCLLQPPGYPKRDKLSICTG